MPYAQRSSHRGQHSKPTEAFSHVGAVSAASFACGPQLAALFSSDKTNEAITQSLPSYGAAQQSCRTFGMIRDGLARAALNQAITLRCPFSLRRLLSLQSYPAGYSWAAPSLIQCPREEALWRGLHSLLTLPHQTTPNHT